MRRQFTWIPIALCVVSLSAPAPLLAVQGHGKPNHARAGGKQKNKPPKAKAHNPGAKKSTKNAASKHDDDRLNDAKMRFLGLDKNRDGVITRGEWPGDDRAFTNHDWNGDGILAGDEVRPGAKKPGRR
jgi:hypothetical protein